MKNFVIHQLLICQIYRVLRKLPYFLNLFLILLLLLLNYLRRISIISILFFIQFRSFRKQLPNIIQFLKLFLSPNPRLNGLNIQILNFSLLITPLVIFSSLWTVGSLSFYLRHSVFVCFFERDLIVEIKRILRFLGFLGLFF